MTVTPIRQKRQRPGAGLRAGLLALPLVVFVAVFALATYALRADAPGRPAIAAFVESRTKDQHFSGCNAARVAGRQDIPSWDPSYRRSMDGDGDGLACEPYRG